MKVSCTQENLNRGLNVVSRVVGTRTTLPVLNNILIRTKDGRLTLAATDLEIGITTWIGAKVDDEGAVTCPARLLADYVTTNNDQTIKLTLDNTTLHLESEHYKANIKGIEAEEFPLIPAVKDGVTLEVAAKEFKDGIAQTVFACALDETRPVLAGVYISASGGKLKMAATDSYRLAEKTIALAAKEKKEAHIIVPQRAMAEVGRLIDESVEKVTILIGENQVQFKFGPTEVVSRLVEGTFPDYQQLIPASAKTTVVLERADFANAIKMASFFARESANNIKLVAKKPATLEIVAVSPELGDNVSQLSAKVTGDDLEIAFNAKFILDVLAVNPASQIVLELSGQMAAGLLRGALYF